MKNIHLAMMDTAKIFANQSYAIRKKVGAVLARDGRIIACGYNGTIPGASNECEEKFQCDRCQGKGCGQCDGSGFIYETSEFVLHAEQNLFMFCAKEGLSTKDTTLYVTMAPCKTCAKLIIAAGITKVFYNETYRDMDGVEFLEQFNIEIKRIDNVK